MTSENAELMNGGLSIKERLERIEDGVGRVEVKLDGKADRADVVGLQIRVSVLETEYAVAKAEKKRQMDDVLEAKVGVEDLKRGQADLYKALKYATATVIGVLTLGDILLRFFTK